MRHFWLKLIHMVVAAALLTGRTIADPVLDWCDLMLDAIRTDTTNPTLSSRNLAILASATYDAVNSITRDHQPYLSLLEVSAGTDSEAAVIAAGREVMLSLYPSFRSRTEAFFATQRAALLDSPGVTNGLKLGRESAVRILSERGNDGANTEFPYIPSAIPGQWRRTPPFSRPPLTPHWGRVRPFCVPSLDAFRPGPPPDLNSREYAAAFNEVKRLGGKVGSDRTPEQSEIASFWSDFSYTAMPPGHWHEIAATVAWDRHLTLPDSARLMALVGLAQADAAILCWETKYRWNLWRPITAIQRAAEDGNPATDPDPAWDHYLVAPPFPAYTSGHSTFSKASAQVLTQFFGTDAITFNARSDSLPGVVRTFHSVSACADEVGISRIYGGIHFTFDNVEGKRSGGLIGDYVFANYLLPVRSLPQVRVEQHSNGVPFLRMHGFFGKPIALEVSADLRNWTPVASQTARAGGNVIPVQVAREGSPSFYRVTAVPSSTAGL